MVMLLLQSVMPGPNQTYSQLSRLDANLTLITPVFLLVTPDRPKVLLALGTAILYRIYSHGHLCGHLQVTTLMSCPCEHLLGCAFC